MQRALIAGAAIAALCSVLGLFLVLRRYSLFGDAVAHSSFGGVALGLFAGVYPLWTAYGVAIGSAMAITSIREKFDISGDAAIAVLLSSGIAIGLVMIGLSGGFSVDIFAVLFGSILLITEEEVLTVLGMVSAMLLIVLFMYRPLLYSTFSERQAQVAGIRVRAVNYLVVGMAGVTVVTSVQLVGVLLMSGLFVIPGVTAIMFGRGFVQTAGIAVAFAVSFVLSGIMLSYMFDITPAGTIVLLGIGVMACTMLLRALGIVGGDVPGMGIIAARRRQ